MFKTYSISQAREHLAELVNLAEEGKAVELTRRGYAVAAIISIEDFRSLMEKRRFFDSLENFYQEHAQSANPMDGDELAGLRDQSGGRKFSW